MASLDGKVAIVTGGASGQGRAEAALFRAEGARVVATDIRWDEEGGAAAADPDLLRFQHDVSREDDWKSVIDATLVAFGRIDILINNAAICHPRSLLETDFESMDRHYRVNQLGPYFGMRLVAEPMAATGGGAIVNISSGAGLRGVASMFGYASSKWALRGMSRCAALDLAPLGIRVNSIYPGLIDTPMLADTPAEQLQAMANAVPFKRIGSPDEVAAACLFLASDAASYVSGAELTVCGALNT